MLGKLCVSKKKKKTTHVPYFPISWTVLNAGNSLFLIIIIISGPKVVLFHVEVKSQQMEQASYCPTGSSSHVCCSCYCLFLNLLSSCFWVQTCAAAVCTPTICVPHHQLVKQHMHCKAIKHWTLSEKVCSSQTCLFTPMLVFPAPSDILISSHWQVWVLHSTLAIIHVFVCLLVKYLKTPLGGFWLSFQELFIWVYSNVLWNQTTLVITM